MGTRGQGRPAARDDQAPRGPEDPPFLHGTFFRSRGSYLGPAVSGKWGSACF